MKTSKVLGALAAAAIVGGCGDYAGGKRTSVSRNDAGESPNFGSATDISKSGEMPTNAANVADNGLGGPAQRESGNYQRQPVPAQSADEELAKQIKVALTTGSTGTTGTIAENQLTKIDVKVRDGHVTLSGPAANENEKRWIERQVAGFKGVKSVQNNLVAGARDLENRPLESLVPRPSNE